MHFDLLSGVLESIMELMPAQTVVHQYRQKRHSPHLYYGSYDSGIVTDLKIHPKQ